MFRKNVANAEERAVIVTNEESKEGRKAIQEREEALKKLNRNNHEKGTKRNRGCNSLV